MKYWNTTAFILFMALFLTACERNVTIDIPQKAPRLVVNGWLEKEKPVEIQIGKSRHILAPGNNGNYETYVVKDAQVVIFENNIPVDTLVYDPMTFRYKTVDTTLIRAGYQYTVKADAPGFVQAESSTALPSQSVIDQVTIVKDARVNTYGEHMDEVTVRFTDPAAERNFYLIQVYSAGYGGYEGHKVWCVSTTDKDLETIGDNADPLATDNCYDGSSLLLKDDNFNGGQKLLRFYVDTYNMQELVDGSNNRIYRPYIKLKRITEDHFKYLKSYGVYYTSSDNPFAEPVNVYTNIKNGYGNFAAYTVAVDTLRQ